MINPGAYDGAVRESPRPAAAATCSCCALAWLALAWPAARPVVAEELTSPVCSEQGCHALDEEAVFDKEDLQNLLQAIDAVDADLAATIRDHLHRHDCSPVAALDRYCLTEASINPESRVKVDAGNAELILRTGQWSTFLIKVKNLAGVTSRLRVMCEQAVVQNARPAAESGSSLQWLEIALLDALSHSGKLTGRPLEYRLVRLRPQGPGKRSAVIALDVGQGTADIGFRNDVVLTFRCRPTESDQLVVDWAERRERTDVVVAAAALSDDLGAPGATGDQPDGGRSDGRRPRSDAELRYWLENMAWGHGFEIDEMSAAIGLAPGEIQAALKRFDIAAGAKPPTRSDRLKLLPYPGGRHPRIGFLEGAVNPQRETKASVFTPWDAESYVVLDAPEAIWSNLGLVYLAHTHIPTLWDRQGMRLEPLEWCRGVDDSLQCERTLPNGITFGTKLVPTAEAVDMEMWLTNGTDRRLTDLRVQNCVMLKAARGFERQTNDNKTFWGPYAACRQDDADRWVITAWDPGDRTWGNADCPCLHSDPQFPDCDPGETQRLRGRLWFYEGPDVHAEMLRVEQTRWRDRSPRRAETSRLVGYVFDAATGAPLPARVTVHNAQGEWLLANSAGGTAVHYDCRQARFPDSQEVHATVSADPFEVTLQPGVYTVRVERGKEFIPAVRQVVVGDGPVRLEFRLRRWIDMAERGWYSGDVHVHRGVDELPNVMLAEDLNVAFPLSFWTTDEAPPLDPVAGDVRVSAEPLQVDPAHVIYPMNTEYEVERIGDRERLLGAMIVLNHQAPFSASALPVGPVADLVRAQGGIVDLDKHSWPWSLMLVPVMGADLFELANNHLWQAEFGLPDWTLDAAPEFMDVERDQDGFTEWGWVDFGLKTYYALVNSGFRLRVSAGTASGVHPVPLGFNRVYVRLPEGFNYDAWVAALDAGRSFVTNGPMLEATFNGRDPGATFHCGGDERPVVRVHALASSVHPLERIEIVVNGRVRREIRPDNVALPSGGYQSEIDVQVSDEKSFWVAVRCFEDNPAGRVRFAHCNPAYVDVAGKPLPPRKEEVAYFIDRMKQQLEVDQHYLSPEQLADFRRALAAYEALAERAE
ncbi:MAG: hypothetical protein CMJ58_07815 [Planctomycetaceae bacterium]|nr:hypothetical protein [Planctomycetaceae bacterium]